MRTAGFVTSAVLAAALAACAHQPARAPAAQAAITPSAVSCPLSRLQGIHVSVADIRDGVAITFTGPASELDQLRDNVHAMADANDKQGDAFAACPCARMPLGSAEAMPSTAPEQTAARPMVGAQPLAIANVEDIATGAVLKLAAKDKKETSALRSVVREDVHALHKNCLAQTRGTAESPTERQGTRP